MNHAALVALAVRRWFGFLLSAFIGFVNIKGCLKIIPVG